jgi:hypothetical protein
MSPRKKKELPDRGAVLDAAQSILAGDLGVLEGCIRLSSLSHAMVPDWRVDADFVVFGAVASEIDHLPFGELRSRWSAEALRRADAEIGRITDGAKEDVIRACENILVRFSTVQ